MSLLNTPLLNRMINASRLVFENATLNEGNNNSAFVRTNSTKLSIQIDWNSTAPPVDYELRLYHLDPVTNEATGIQLLDVNKVGTLGFLDVILAEAWSTYFFIRIVIPSGAGNRTVKRVSIVDLTDIPTRDELLSIAASNEAIETNTSLIAQNTALSQQTGDFQKIADAIGLDRIKMLLKMEESSAGVLSDTYNPDLKFSIKGDSFSLKDDGPFGKYIDFGVQDGASESHIEQVPLMENLSGGSYPAYAEKYATRLKVIQKRTVNKCAIKLKKIGAPTGTIRVNLQKDNAGPDENAWIRNPQPRYTKELFTIDCADISTTEGFYGLAFDTPLLLEPAGTKYWLVLEYVDTTGVDASNYITWEHETTNNFGEARAVFNSGSWAVTSDQNHVFKLYEAHLRMRDSFTIIMPMKTLKKFGRQILGINAMGVNTLRWQMRAENVMDIEDATVESGKTTGGFYFPDGWHIIAMTFDISTAQGKIKIYVNGKLISDQRLVIEYKTVDGEGGIGFQHQSTPWHFGTRLTDDTHRLEPYRGMWGSLGAIIMCEDALDQDEIMKITNLMRGDN